MPKNLCSITKTTIYAIIRRLKLTTKILSKNMKKRYFYWFIFIAFVTLLCGSIFYIYQTNFLTQSHPTPSANELTFYNEKWTLNESNRIGLGVFLIDQESTQFKSVLEFEDLVSRKMEYVLFFKAWGDEDSKFPTSSVPYLKQYNLKPIITWEPWKRDFTNRNKIQPEWTLKSIADGDHDEYIIEWAIEARNSKLPITIRFAHEMVAPDGVRAWYPWQGDPVNYKKAFQRIVNLFKTYEATNVRFMWNPMDYTNSGLNDRYYPGDEYVDIIGLTVISGGGEKDCSILKTQYDSIKKWSKPVMIAELLSGNKTGLKEQWYEACLNDIPKYSNIIGVNVIQVDDTTVISSDPVDWRINSSISSFQAFKKSIRNGYYK